MYISEARTYQTSYKTEKRRQETTRTEKIDINCDSEKTKRENKQTKYYDSEKRTSHQL